MQSQQVVFVKFWYTELCVAQSHWSISGRMTSLQLPVKFKQYSTKKLRLYPNKKIHSTGQNMDFRVHHPRPAASGHQRWSTRGQPARIVQSGSLEVIWQSRNTGKKERMCQGRSSCRHETLSTRFTVEDSKIQDKCVSMYKGSERS